MEFNPRLGDKIRTIGRGGVPHYGIIVATSNNQIRVAHNSKAHGRVVIEPLWNFSLGQPVFREQQAPIGHEQVVVKRALEFIGKLYDFINFNCDHFATYAQTGRIESPQLQNAFWVSVALGICIFTRSENKYDRQMGRYRDANGRFARN